MDDASKPEAQRTTGPDGPAEAKLLPARSVMVPEPGSRRPAAAGLPHDHPFADGQTVLPQPGDQIPGSDPASTFIQIEFRFEFQRHQIYSDCGKCLLHLFLRNFGTIDAYQPFMCLSPLGLELSAAPGWDMQDVSNVRKLRRFGPLNMFKLVPQDAAHCCTIAMPFSTMGGGVIQYAAQSKHRFETLPDLRLTCVVGSANYPSGKMQFTVPAADLKTYFARLVEIGEVPPFADSAAA